METIWGLPRSVGPVRPRLPPEGPVEGVWGVKANLEPRRYQMASKRPSGNCLGDAFQFDNIHHVCMCQRLILISQTFPCGFPSIAFFESKEFDDVDDRDTDVCATSQIEVFVFCESYVQVRHHIVDRM